MKNAKITGVAMAIAAAGMFATAPVSAMSGGNDSKVHCYGVNSCKGHNDCKTDKNACKGHGSCKGQGFLSMSKSECDEKGGTVGK
jgi:hypothetical protein